MGDALKRPHACMLVAVSLDGKISPRRRKGQPNPIGPELIDAGIIRLHNSARAAAEAVMVGLKCILLDDSTLIPSKAKAKPPTRVVLDGLAEIPPTAKVLDCTTKFA